MIRTELHQLRLFLAVAQELHFRRAAETMHIAQPALSQQIRSLETRLGVELFDRHNRRVELTRAGHALVEEARRTLAQADHALDVARAAGRGEIGLLRVGFVGSVSYELLPRLVKRIRDRAPKLQLRLVQMTTDEQIEALTRHEIDVGVARQDGADTPEALEDHALLSERMAIVLPLSHRLAACRRIRLSELQTEEFIFPPRNQARRYHDWLVQLCRNAGFSPQVTQRTLQFPALIGLAAAGLGIGFVPGMVAAFRRSDVRLVPAADTQAYSTVAVVTRVAESDPAIERFLHEARLEVQAMRHGSIELHTERPS